MRTIRSTTGPFFERPHFKPGEIEQICTKELRAAGLYPSRPEPIRIERFIEKRFGISAIYEKLPERVLGFTRFGTTGVTEIVVSSDLDGDPATPTERRLRTTLAHEAGHGLCHAHLFYLGTKPLSLFDETDDSPSILCRDVAGEVHSRSIYHGRWWEFQANQAIGGLLMPRLLVHEALQAFATPAGSLGQVTLADDQRELAVKQMAATFNVNPAVVRIRLAEILSVNDNRQLQL
jgi:hypothetical protein